MWTPEALSSACDWHFNLDPDPLMRSPFLSVEKLTYPCYWCCYYFIFLCRRILMVLAFWRVSLLLDRDQWRELLKLRLDFWLILMTFFLFLVWKYNSGTFFFAFHLNIWLNFTAQNNLLAILYLIGIEIFWFCQNLWPWQPFKDSTRHSVKLSVLSQLLVNSGAV